MNPPRSHLLVFAKAPVPGQVKTRLVPTLGARGAAELYERLTLHALATALKSGVGPVDLWCTPSTEHPFFKRCAKDLQVTLHRQVEGTLGWRMAHAIQTTLERTAPAILIGTDCPSLTQDDLIEAATFLQDFDAVITPTEDGGYVLIGLRRASIILFDGIAWGTKEVLQETRRRLRTLGWQWQELPERWDVDRPEDVERLRGTNYLSVPSFKE
jgi:rSAM/selenodomain-associated transferase 1